MRPRSRTDLNGSDARTGIYGSNVLGSKRVPAVCLIGRSTPGTHGRFWTAHYTGSPVYRQADPLRKPTF